MKPVLQGFVLIVMTTLTACMKPTSGRAVMDPSQERVSAPAEIAYTGQEFDVEDGDFPSGREVKPSGSDMARASIPRPSTVVPVAESRRVGIAAQGRTEQEQLKLRDRAVQYGEASELVTQDPRPNDPNTDEVAAPSVDMMDLRPRSVVFKAPTNPPRASGASSETVASPPAAAASSPFLPVPVTEVSSPVLRVAPKKAVAPVVTKVEAPILKVESQTTQTSPTVEARALPPTAPLPPRAERPKQLDQPEAGEKESDEQTAEVPLPQRVVRPVVQAPASPAPTASPTPAPTPARTAQTMTLPAPSRKVIVETGTVTPTIYFIAVVDEDRASCSSGEKTSLYTERMRRRMQVCPRTLSFCAEQGSCMIKKDGRWSTFNILNRVNGVSVFTEVTSGCTYGYGVQQSCLDPFYSVAADMDIYDPGDVIYVPALRGLDLPNGRKHDGYLIVRDKGRLIRGKGRFDFFTGMMNWRQNDNPFVKAGLNNKHTDLVYYRIARSAAQVVLAKRGYPRLPGQNTEMAMASRRTENTGGVPTSRY